MDLSSYINSGVLELYVLDRLSPDERREVERYAEQYPEVKGEITEIEVALEKFAVLSGAGTPPSPAVLENVLPKVRAASALPRAAVRPPVTTAATAAATAAPARSTGALTWILAAALLLALAGLVYYLTQANDRSETINELQQRFSTLEQECEQARVSNQNDRQQLALLTDIDTRDVILTGSDNAPDSRAVVFYNPTSGEVLFSAANLPAPPAGKQYQLWAIDAQGPQDLGVLSPTLTNQELLDVRYLPDVAAFAITLEDEGGKPSPDLTQLQVIGEVGP